MPLLEFRNRLWHAEHDAYEQSMFAPSAPEYSTGEVLLGATYRKLILNIPERDVKLENLPLLADQVQADLGVGEELFASDGALVSPPPERSVVRLQLMPLTPEVARHACVLGIRPNRWDPGRLLLSTLGSGLGPVDGLHAVVELQEALSIDDSDDIFAVYVDKVLRTGAQPGARPSPLLGSIAWRPVHRELLNPAERFSRDIRASLRLKQKLTRRQWTVLLEASLRLGLATHALWLCQLHHTVWRMCVNAIVGGPTPSATDVAKAAWSRYASSDPLLDVGSNSIPLMKHWVQRYMQGRIGINLALHALTDASITVPSDCLEATSTVSAPERIAAFLSHVAANRGAMIAAMQRHLGVPTLERAAQDIADQNPRMMSASSGPSKNLFEFLRHTLGQLQLRDSEHAAYDQSYVLHKRNPRQTNSPWPVHPGPACLILLVHACCQSLEGLPASIEDLRRHLSEYGIRAPGDELQNGPVARTLQRLGLVVDSPDAGGGQLLVDPF